MATTTLTYSPASGRQYIDLTSWAGDASFATTPVSGDQVEAVDTLTLNADGTVSGSDGSYTLRHIRAANGTVEAVSYQIDSSPVPSEESASATVTYSAGSDRTRVTLESPVEPYLFEDWATAPSASEQLISTTAEGTFDVNGNWAGDSEASLTVWFVASDGTLSGLTIDTTGLESVVDTTPDIFTVPALTNQPLNQYVEFTPVTVTGVDAGEDIAVSVSGTNVQYAVDAGAGYGAFTSTGTNVQLNYDVKARILTSDIGSDERTGTLTIGDKSSSLSATTQAAVPQGVITVGQITKDKNSASIPFTYNKSDAQSYEYSIGGGNWQTVTSPISLSSLDPETAYSGLIRAVNATGSGTEQSFSFTTDALQPPTGTITFGSPTESYTTIQQPFSYDGADADSYEYSVDGGAWQTVVSPISLSSLNMGTDYQISVRAVNTDGYSSVYSTTVSTLAAPALTLELSGATILRVELGSTFTEPGFTATSGVDGDLTGSVQTSGTVDTNTVDNYILSYTVTDSLGQEGTKQRTVVVFDPSAIVLRRHGKSSTNCGTGLGL